MNRRIIFAHQDLGGMRALAPVLSQLSELKDFEIYSFSGRSPNGTEKPLPGNITHESFPMENGFSSEKKLRHAIRTLDPEVIVTATSIQPHSIDKRIHLIAREANIPCVSILDYWCRYLDRYSRMQPYEEFAYLPDYIFVMDKFSRKEMIAEGFRPETLIVTGHPYLAWLYANKPTLSDDNRTRIRDRYGMNGKTIITFVCEPSHDMVHNEQYRFPLYEGNGARMVVVLGAFLEVLNDLCGENADKFLLVNKLHPNNSLNDFQWIDPARYRFRILNLLENEMDKHALVLLSSWVVGMTSMMLLESIVCGIPSLSIIPQESEKNILMSNRISEDFLVRNPEELREFISSWMDPRVRNHKWKKFQSEIESVIKSPSSALDHIMRIIDTAPGRISI